VSTWQQWTAREWNDVLFEHFFSQAEGPALPVTRLVVTKDELYQAVKDTAARPADVETAFVRALRCSPWQFRHQMSDQWLNFRGEWNQQAVPGFFVYLVFTCFAASTISKDVFGVGDFRKRLQILLAHPTDTNYELPHLARLWEALSVWITRCRSQGKPYRQLVLPDPGRMTRIGYSLRLAFPGRRDREALARLVSGRGLERESPVRAVLKLVGDQAALFTSEFWEAHERFRRAFLRGEEGLECFPFWSAVQDAIAAELVTGKQTDRAGKFQLFMQPDSDVPSELFLASRTSVKTISPVELRPVDGVEDHPFIVATNDESRDGVRGVLSLLLNGVLHRAVPSFASSSVQRAVRQGVLLFVRGESGLRQLTTSRPEGQRVWVIMREGLVSEFLNALPASARPQFYPSRYTGWHECAPIDARVLRHFDQLSVGPLSAVTCLQAVVRPAAVVLSGGIKTDVGYLGFNECLPEVRVRGAERVELVPIGPDGTHQASASTPLTSIHKHPGHFRFPRASGNTLEGTFRLVGKTTDRLVAQRQLTFRAELLWREFVYPDDSSKWFVEGGLSDICSAPFQDDQFTEIPEGAKNGRARHERAAATPRRTGRALLKMDVDRTLPKELSRERTTELARLIEVIAALGSNRQGIGEGELLDWFEKVLSAGRQAPVWDVVRAWVEAGYLDARTRTTWRGRVYFARAPRLVSLRIPGGTKLVLTGLAPMDVRLRVQRSAAARGAEPLNALTASSWVPPLPSWSLSSSAVADLISTDTGVPLARPRYIHDIVAPTYRHNKRGAFRADQLRTHRHLGLEKRVLLTRAPRALRDCFPQVDGACRPPRCLCCVAKR
jgi:hypothetical protein